MMPLWQILILAVAQGITEFLPISSDGHLVLLADVLGTGEADVSSVVIALHMGTLGSIVVFYFRRLWQLLSDDRRVIPLLILGTIPAVIFGVPLKFLAEDAVLESPLLAGLMLPVTGMFLLYGAAAKPGDEDYRQLSWWKSWWIGVAQALAILPGVSRSGSTISLSLRLGLSRESAATFSFLLAVPALIGAGVLQGLKIIKEGDYTQAVSPIDLILGGLVSFAVGLVALWVLVRMLERGRFAVFGWYCIVLGIAATAWQIWKLAA